MPYNRRNAEHDVYLSRVHICILVVLRRPLVCMEMQQTLHLSSNMQVTTKAAYGGDSDNLMSNPVVALVQLPC
jgi:hypothetical protein